MARPGRQGSEAGRIATEPAASAESAGPARLTRMQRVVVRLYAQGLEPKAIAARLGLSPSTVYEHLRRGRDALGLELYRELRAREPELRPALAPPQASTAPIDGTPDREGDG